MLFKCKEKFKIQPHSRTWLPAFSWAKQYLQTNQLIPIPTDKDGGYALVKKSVYIDLVQSGLSMPKYGVLPRITLDYERRIKSMHAVLLVVQKAFDSKEDGLCRGL